MRGTGRRAEIARILATDGQVKVEALAERLGVTTSTIRRDLNRLTAEGNVARTYGGALVTAPPAEPSLHQRETLAPREKDVIGRWAAARIEPGETVMLDAGTTVGRVAHHLRGRSDLTVITNGLTSIIELADAEGVEVTVLGGSLRHISHGMIGPLTELSLSRLSADRVFLGADGLVADRGICEASPHQTRAKELMASRGRDVYVLVDSSKIGRAPFAAWAVLERPWTLVTDSGATEDLLAPFRALSHVSVEVLPA
jgi:DeoR/GlpR family transcriptional regulator of sugar metabolism